MASSPYSPGGVVLVGFGEAAQAFAGGWTLPAGQVSAYDIKSHDQAQRPALHARYRLLGVNGRDSLTEALRDARVVFSLVTADQALVAAEAARDLVPTGCLWLDCNSCAPDVKRRAGATLERAGVHYVDVAVMAPVLPARHHVPLLLSGPNAEHAARDLVALDMRPRVVGAEVGRASTIKMLRSVMIKGLEALTAECLLAARRAGVVDEVIASFQASDPQLDWVKASSYRLARMVQHGARRAEEMRAVAATVEALGLSPSMSVAAAHWQYMIASLGLDASKADLLTQMDDILRVI